MSLVIYYKKSFLGAAYANVEIPYYEESMDEDICIEKEMPFLKFYGLEGYLNYENAPVEVKTFLSVKHFPDKVYDISLCSPDVTMSLLKLQNGRIFAPYMAMNYVFIKRLNEQILDLDVVVNDEGDVKHCKSLEEILREKHRMLDILRNRDINERYSVTPDTDNITVYTADLSWNMSNNLRSMYENCKKEVALKFNIDTKCRMLLIGHTGDLVHDLIVSAMDNKVIFDSKNNRLEIECFDLYELEKQYEKLKERNVVFGNNVFDTLFKSNELKLYVFDNVDKVVLKRPDLLDDFMEYIENESTKTRFIFFARYFSNSLVTSFDERGGVRVADVTVKRANNAVKINISGGQDLCE